MVLLLYLEMTGNSGQTMARAKGFLTPISSWRSSPHLFFFFDTETLTGEEGRRASCHLRSLYKVEGCLVAITLAIQWLLLLASVTDFMSIICQKIKKVIGPEG